MTEDRMVGWHYQFNGHGFEEAPGDSEGQGGLAMRLQRVGHDCVTELNFFGWPSLVAQLIKNLPIMQETWVRFLGWEDPLEKEMATHSSILA